MSVSSVRYFGEVDFGLCPVKWVQSTFTNHLVDREGKATAFLARGVNLLIIDLFPPTSSDPQGIYKAIWDEICEEPFELPTAKPYTISAFEAEPIYAAYVECVGIGDAIPPMPVFLDPGQYVLAPLEEAYAHSWEKCPREMKDLVLKAMG